jgi:hypothetical protein
MTSLNSWTESPVSERTRLKITVSASNTQILDKHKLEGPWPNFIFSIHPLHIASAGHKELVV